MVPLSLAKIESNSRPLLLTVCVCARVRAYITYVVIFLFKADTVWEAVDYKHAVGVNVTFRVFVIGVFILK